MAEYQNIFTQVQITRPGLCRRAADRADLAPVGEGRASSYWLGKIGDAQVGPFYLGWTRASPR